MTDRQQRFIKLLEEIFEINKSDLDFGIYRILNFRRTEIKNFFNNRLPELIQQEVAPFAASGVDELKTRILELEKQLGGKEMIEKLPDEMPIKVQYAELRQKLSSGVDLEAIESDVYSALYSFFNRYYDEGDFISKRRYKEGVYALPYEGEEVKLYWANQDQYYVKTSENFKDYTFTADDVAVHFRLVDATTEHNNNKERDDAKRVFMLFEEDEERFPGLHTFDFEDVDGPGGIKKELVIRFRYDIPEDKRRKYADENYSRIVNYIAMNQPRLVPVLMRNSSLKPKEEYPLIKRHLDAYVAKNSFDYFIHKDLKGFLSRELDFYIKNEILHIDDIEREAPERAAVLFAKIRAIRKVSKLIIDFLAQIENFQKRLWLKKKFVVETNWCITLDRIEESFYPEIAANPAQVQDWMDKFAIAEIDGGVTVEFLKENQGLVVDTGFFSQDFTSRLVASFENLDEMTDGILINSDNFHALSLIKMAFKGRISSVITDPPYNTGDDNFLYKDNYMHSSWLSMMESRFDLIYPLLSDGGWVSVNINDIEFHNLEKLLESYDWSSLNSVCVKMSHLSGMKMSHVDRKFPKIKESIIVASKGDSARMTPVYEACEWDDAFERYTSWVEFVNPEDPSSWTTMSVRQAAIRSGIDVENKRAFDRFKIENAHHIYQRAKNDSVAHMPKDDKFHKVVTPTGMCKYVLNAKEVLFASSYIKEIDGAKVPAILKGDMWTDIGINNVHNEGGVQLPNGKKPVKLYERLISVLNNVSDGYILDPFAGSATVAHAVMLTNVANGRHNKFIAIQDGFRYFNEKTKQRIKNVMYSSTWKLDRPVSRESSSLFVKYMRLESYEDTLDNISLDSERKHRFLLSDEYMVNYLLDVESRESLLNMKRFTEPFSSTMKITEQNERKVRKVDMVETFNYLIGLSVTSKGVVSTFRADDAKEPAYKGAVELLRDKNGDFQFQKVDGTLPDGRRALVIWRNITEDVLKSNAALDAYFQMHRLSARKREYDVIYVNGDNNLENLRVDEENWKVVMIEQEFNRKMWEEQ